MKHEPQRTGHRNPIIRGQLDEAGLNNNEECALEKFNNISLNERNKSGVKSTDYDTDDTGTGTEEALILDGQTLPKIVQVYPIKRFGDLCPGFLGSSLVSLLNSDEGGCLLVGVDQAHRVLGLRLSRPERDRARQQLDSVCRNNIQPTLGAKHVDIEFIPINSLKDTFVIKITVIMSEILKLCKFRLKGLRAKGYEDGIYMNMTHEYDQLSESAYFSA